VHYGIATPLFSAHAHNERARAQDIAARLARGTRGALVVDAGSPGVSDPGARVVRAVLDAGFTVRVVPGPSAVIAALSVSGLDTAAFTFAGFPAGETGRARCAARGLAGQARDVRRVRGAAPRPGDARGARAARAFAQRRRPVAS
jgi:16S rRNA (cytidine1402-2'-O)-methyltransferase